MTHCQSLNAADKSRKLKMVSLWQARRPQHDTVEGWMPPVNIYLPCECVSVCGRAQRQELLWGFISGMTRQPVIYEHLVLLFKHSLISRQTFPEARAKAKSGLDQTRPHTVFLQPRPATWTKRCARRPGTARQTAYVSVYRVWASWTAERNSATLQWWKSSALCSTGIC